ncbi:MAG: glycosyltransferase, partial [Planctomycetes bacterium]|nr:glycosyltransferase [Planctomycetota bacterium]
MRRHRRLRAAAARDPRIRVVERPTNGGIVAASQDGLDACRGEMVALLDHDDLLHPEALAELDAVITPEVDYAYTDQDLI